jgi:hypothetical protein
MTFWIASFCFTGSRVASALRNIVMSSLTANNGEWKEKKTWGSSARPSGCGSTHLRPCETPWSRRTSEARTVRPSDKLTKSSSGPAAAEQAAEQARSTSAPGSQTRPFASLNHTRFLELAAGAHRTMVLTDKVGALAVGRWRRFSDEDCFLKKRQKPSC